MKEKEVYAYVAEHCPYCALCGSSWNLHIHHIVPRSQGGGTNLHNLIRLCEHCHLYVVHANMKKWVPRLQRILNEVIVKECHYDKELYENEEEY